MMNQTARNEIDTIYWKPVRLASSEQSLEKQAAEMED